VTIAASRRNVTWRDAQVMASKCKSCRGRGTKWLRPRGTSIDGPAEVRKITCPDCDGSGETPEIADEDAA
jgi:DnaJ-class molecular chaperone